MWKKKSHDDKNNRENSGRITIKEIKSLPKGSYSWVRVYDASFESMELRCVVSRWAAVVFAEAPEGDEGPSALAGWLSSAAFEL
eukprot:scaffold444976_cov20-Prasinocladus_malaysianus.AAC.1